MKASGNTAKVSNKGKGGAVIDIPEQRKGATEFKVLPKKWHKFTRGEDSYVAFQHYFILS